jgi:carbon monoxide dehydrogenase subunit G
MASIHREIRIAASPDTAWDALRDVGALHTRLVPGFVTDTKLEEGARIVTFGNGMVAKELLVDVDDEARRVAWSVVGTPLMTHHNASAQVFPDGPGRCRFVWIADLLPHEAAPTIAAMIDQGMGVIQKTLERAEKERGA